MFTEFTGSLAGPLEIGNALVIAGKTVDGAKRFTVNLRKDKHRISDIGLSLMTQFSKDIIIRNSFINGEWGEEETFGNLNTTINSNPLIAGEFFILCIFVGETHYHISINHRFYCTYKYRRPINEIKIIEVRGHVQVVSQIDHRTIFPVAWPLVQSSDRRHTFSNDIPILFTPGHVLVITAIPYNNSRGQFIVRFQMNDTKREGLHFSVRFDQEFVVRNAMNARLEFGPEERDGGFPFVFEQQFRLAIAFTETEFMFAVDGNYFTSFAYRSTDLLQTLCGLKIHEINGLHVSVTGIDHIEMDPECNSFEKYSRHNNYYEREL